MYQIFTLIFLTIRLTWTPFCLKSFQTHSKILNEFDYTKIENIKTFTPELKRILYSLLHPVYITKPIIELGFFIWLCATGFKFFVPFICYSILYLFFEVVLKDNYKKLVMNDLLDISLICYVLYYLKWV